MDATRPRLSRGSGANPGPLYHLAASHSGTAIEYASRHVPLSLSPFLLLFLGAQGEVQVCTSEEARSGKLLLRLAGHISGGCPPVPASRDVRIRKRRGDAIRFGGARTPADIDPRSAYQRRVSLVHFSAGPAARRLRSPGRRSIRSPAK